MATDDGSTKEEAVPATDELTVDVRYQKETRQIPVWLRNAGIGSWSIIGVLIVIVAVVFATAKISMVFIAVFVAFVFTSVLNPIVDRLAKHMGRGLAVAVSVLGSFLILAALLAFVIASVAGQWPKLIVQLGDGLEQIVSFINSTPFDVSLTSDEVYDWARTLILEGQEYVAQNWQSLVGQVASNAGGIALGITVFALSLFITIFFLLQGSQMWRWFLNMLPTHLRGKWNHAAGAGWSAFSGYARGTMIIALIDAALAWILLEILRVPLAPALAVLVMIGALIPMIGAPAAMLVAMIVALATEGVMTAIIVGVGIAAIGQLEGHILQPLIMGKQVSLNPVVVGIGVVAGTLLAGLLGAIIAIPVISVTWAVFNSLYRRDPPIVGPLPDPYTPPSVETKEPGMFKKIGAKFKDGQSQAPSAN